MAGSTTAAARPPAAYDLRFTLCDAVTNGNAIGALTNAATGVTNGLFMVTLDFGGVFNGSNYWLEIAARTNGGASFSTLSPRQPITPTPYAIYSANAGSAVTAATAGTAGSANSVSAANIAGTLTLVQLPAVVQTNAAQLNIPNTTTQATAGVVIVSGFIADTTTSMAVRVTRRLRWSRSRMSAVPMRSLPPRLPTGW